MRFHSTGKGFILLLVAILVVTVATGCGKPKTDNLTAQPLTFEALSGPTPPTVGGRFSITGLTLFDRAGQFVPSTAVPVETGSLSNPPALTPPAQGGPSAITPTVLGGPSAITPTVLGGPSSITPTASGKPTATLPVDTSTPPAEGKTDSTPIVVFPLISPDNPTLGLLIQAPAEDSIERISARENKRSRFTGQLSTISNPAIGKFYQDSLGLNLTGPGSGTYWVLTGTQEGVMPGGD